MPRSDAKPQDNDLLQLERERTRATLVIGLIGSVIGLRIYAGQGKVSLIFGVLLLYWGLYVVLTVIGISKDLYPRKRCDQFLSLGHLVFNFAMIVVIDIVALVFLDWMGPLKVIQWGFSTVGIFVIILYFASEFFNILKQVWQKKMIEYAKNIWVKWAKIIILTFPLLVLDLFLKV